MKQTLTKKQKQMLDYIRAFAAENGYAPTFREIMDGLHYSSVATVAQHIENLVNKGFLYKRNNEARSIQLVDAEVDTIDTRGLPVMGMIAAGEPITTLDNPNETLQVPNFMIKSDTSYVLQVQGESMIEDGILSGDYIVVRENRVPQNGDVVVAMIGGDSATLKHFYREDGRIRLQPANSAYEPIYVEADEGLEIQGVVTGVVRAY
ncbi:MAG: transcriptional repressor LexA [Candidatus Saccharimonadales bacterium]